MTKKIGGQLGPLTRHFFPKPSDQNFEIAILFSIVETPKNMSLEITWPPKAPGEGSLSYKICLLSTYSICYWKVCVHCWVGREGQIFCWGILHGENSPWRGKFPWGWTFNGKFYVGGVCQKSDTKFLYMFCFLFTDSILRVEILRQIVVRVNFRRGKFSPGPNCPEDVSGRGGFLLWDGARYPGVI